MKKLLLAVTLLLAFNASAKLSIDNCYQLEELAGVIMEARQAGSTMGEMIKLADNHKLTEALVIDAFEVPLYETDEYKQREIDKYKNKVFKMCFQSIGEKI